MRSKPSSPVKHFVSMRYAATAWFFKYKDITSLNIEHYKIIENST
ncbi:hypothetical protein [Candidatus Thiodiazotropha endoloripes]|nr:hypothetical protein [Candidatus Thiodiazotropha endoloripes]MCW4183466.1 hypothetical protein [Candidatus Thiodiazotropha weberae]MCW4192233.1 hypothetical protein [Candidatus Thiodiazotropha weberae]